MYRIDGSSDLKEDVLDDWRATAGSARYGSATAPPSSCSSTSTARPWTASTPASGRAAAPHQGWTAISRVLDWLAENWDQPEEGIWETRGGRQAFTYGRVMCWVAFDRGIRLALEHGRPAPLERWTAERDQIYRQVMERGFHTSRQAFVQHYDTDVLDSALLRMPTVGMIDGRDPMWLSTLEAMDDELVTDSLVYRYNPEASPDGLRGSEGTFSLCTFAYVDALTRAGRLDEARTAFEKMLTYGNHVGLYSEEIALTGEQIGNFPQAFTHLSLIDAAVTLDSACRGGARGRRTGQAGEDLRPCHRVVAAGSRAPDHQARDETGKGRRGPLGEGGGGTIPVLGLAAGAGLGALAKATERLGITEEQLLKIGEGITDRSPTMAERKAKGKEAWGRTPPSSHSGWRPGPPPRPGCAAGGAKCHA